MKAAKQARLSNPTPNNAQRSSRRNFGSTRCVQIKSRTVSTHAAHGGRSCGDLSQTRTCSCPSSIDDKITYGEECDDGNSVNGDGCSSTQTIEEGFLCSPSAPTSSSYFVNSKSSCHGLWNNGVLEFGEDCDDGNENPNDGCHNGVRDTNYICDVPGQACTKARIRRDWNQLDDTEKELYVSAINDLKKSGIYDDFVHVHGLTNNKEYAHGTGGFLPWHRWYLFQFEEALRNQDDKYKDVTIPYWDWGEEADLCAAQGGCRYLDEKSEIIAAFGGPGSSQTSMGQSQAFGVNFAEGQLGSSETVGPFGSSAQDPNTSDEDLNIGCVGAGKHGFEGFWVVPKLPTHPDKTCLSRSRSLESDGTEGFTSAADMIETIMQFDTYGAYGGFRAKLEGLPHANPHNLLGGHIRTFVSPADPLFFSHHTYVDKLWAMWQDCHNHEDVDKAAISSSGDDYYMHVFDKNSENVMDETQAKNLGLYDGVDGALPFFAIDPNSAAPSGACIDHTATPNNAAGSPTAHSCTECVAYYDDWCNSEWTAALPGQWDSTCVAICSNQCTAYCGTPPTVIHASQVSEVASEAKRRVKRTVGEQRAMLKCTSSILTLSCNSPLRPSSSRSSTYSRRTASSLTRLRELRDLASSLLVACTTSRTLCSATATSPMSSTRKSSSPGSVLATWGTTCGTTRACRRTAGGLSSRR